MAALGLALRPARAGDQSSLRRLYGSHRAAELAPAPWPAAAKERFLDDQFGHQTAHYAANHPDADRLIVTRAAPPLAPRDIGRLYVSRDAATWRLLELGLTPTEQGRGTGAVLVGWLCDAAASAGAAEVELHVASDNGKAIAFYRRLGFGDVASAVSTHRRMTWRSPGVS